MFCKISARDDYSITIVDEGAKSTGVCELLEMKDFNLRACIGVSSP